MHHVPTSIYSPESVILFTLRKKVWKASLSESLLDFTTPEIPRTEMEVLKELASDESSYRSLTKSWFEHSPLHQALKKIADKKVNLVVATDHGSRSTGNARR